MTVALRIEDYGVIGDGRTAALVGRDGSIDWLCVPRFDSGACFSALLGTAENGRWSIAPAGKVISTARRYRGDTLILETTFETEAGAVVLIDFMPCRTRRPQLVRIVRGLRGRVDLRMDLSIRFDYGSVVPWVRRFERGLRAVAGPDTLVLWTDAPLTGRDMTTVSEFSVSEGEEVPFVLSWRDSGDAKEGPPPAAARALASTERWWRSWSGRCRYEGPWRDAVLRSLITLKSLIHAPTGGMVAALTTSLPENIGGVRNWDYRFCWVRDATLTLDVLLSNGFVDEAEAWRKWLVRSVAGTPSQVNILYGLSGERRLTEIEADWLPGYEGSRPVRLGNAAYRQRQLDIFGEVFDALYLARSAGLSQDEDAWRVQQAMLDFLATAWRDPDEGIWEVRGPQRHFTHSKVMAWTAVDRAVRTVERFSAEGDLEKWKALRAEIHEDVMRNGFDSEANTFVQYYGSKEVDASLLMIPMVGFLPPDDPRVRGTVEAVRRELLRDGFVYRYRTRPDLESLPPGEGAFLPCSFWLADCLALQGKTEEGARMFERLLSLRNDLGLLSEEYDPKEGRLLGNFPQAFTHVALVNTAMNLARSSQGPRFPV